MKTISLSKAGWTLLFAGMMFFIPANGYSQENTAPPKAGDRFIQNFDKDGDGKVSREEFPSREEAFTRLDTNGDDVVDAGEAPGKGRFIQKFDKDGDGKVSREEFSGHDDRFARMDKNSDGYIDSEEISRMQHRCGKRGGNFIKRFDTNSDGKISKEEFRGPDERFTSLDKNGDGFIDESEVPRKPHRSAVGDNSNNQ